MKKILLFSVIVFFISITVLAQNTVDIQGWNNTTWGMTEKDLTKLFDGKIIDTQKKEVDNENIYSNLKLEKYDIDGVKFDVNFGFNANDNKLKKVLLRARPALAEYFSQFEQLLTEKYGKAANKDESAEYGSFDKIETWLLPSTKIELNYHYNKSLGSVLLIIYSDKKITKGKLDKL